MTKMRDAYDDFIRHDAEQEEWLESRPVCDICGEPIQDEAYHYIFGHPVCDRCLDDTIVFID